MGKFTHPEPRNPFAKILYHHFGVLGERRGRSQRFASRDHCLVIKLVALNFVHPLPPLSLPPFQSFLAAVQINPPSRASIGVHYLTFRLLHSVTFCQSEKFSRRCIGGWGCADFSPFFVHFGGGRGSTMNIDSQSGRWFLENASVA